MTSFSASPTRLLLVEDDSEVSSMLKTFLSEEGYQITIAATLEEALTLLEAHFFHLIFTELAYSPGKDPLLSAQPLLEAAQPIPVVVFTAWAVAAENVAKQGFAALVSKPFDLEDLLTTIAACLGAPFTPQQQRQAKVVERYFQVLGNKEWDTLLSLCTEDVVYHLPAGTPFSATICGKAAFRAYSETTFNNFPNTHFENVMTFPLPSGLAARYVGHWVGPDGSPQQLPGSIIFKFAGEAIKEIGVKLNNTRLEKLITRKTT